MLSAQKISIEEKKIEAIKDWPKLYSLRNIQVILGFTNFYKRFIQGFNKIAISITSMLKITFIINAKILLKSVDNYILLILKAK